MTLSDNFNENIGDIRAVNPQYEEATDGEFERTYTKQIVQD